jgi:hypothetical protein
MFENVHAQRLTLNGVWQISIDGRSGPLTVPGVWEVQGYPRDVDSAVLTRTFDVPEGWRGQAIQLEFGAVSYHVEVWLNGIHVGTHHGLWSAFTFDVSAALAYGGENALELRIVKPSNRLDGTYSYRHVPVGFIPYVSTTFGGVWQDVTLVAYDQGAWHDVHVRADFEARQVTFSARLGLTDGAPPVKAELRDPDGVVIAVQRAAHDADGGVRAVFDLSAVRSWSPDDPAQYTLTLTAPAPAGDVTVSRSFGFRALMRSADGEGTLLNGEPVMLRGILHWGWYPDRLAPTPSEDEIRAEFHKIRALGFNMVKLCLFVPHEAFFRVADEEGMLLWLELPLWWQVMNPHLREVVQREYRDILAAVHHHPSIVIYSLGCELDAYMGDGDLLGDLDRAVRDRTCGVLVCDNSGSGEAYGGLDFDYADFNDYHFYSDLEYFTPLLNLFRRDWRSPRPWIFGEFCAYDDYRDPTRLIDADGGRPWWRDLFGVDASVDRWAYSIQEERMAALGLPYDHADLAHRSRQQGYVVRKHTLEQVRLRRAMGGYVITGLRDTPINSAGVFDDAGNSKVDADAFSAINGERVLLLDVRRARVWRGGDQPAPVDPFVLVAGQAMSWRVILSNSGKPFVSGVLRWQIHDADGLALLIEGESNVQVAVHGHVPRQIGRIDWMPPATGRAAQVHLTVTLDDGTHNAWPLVIVPPPAAESWPTLAARYDPSGVLEGFAALPAHEFAEPERRVLVASALTPQVVEFVENGGACLLIQNGPGMLPVKQQGFWFEALNLIRTHPVWDGFPHDGYTGMAFYHLAPDYALDAGRLAEALPQARDVRPLLTRLHTRHFTTTEYMLEIALGAGRLIATTLRFDGGRGDQVNGLAHNPMARHLLDRLVGYLAAP